MVLLHQREGVRPDLRSDARGRGLLPGHTELKPVCVNNGGNEDQVALLASFGVEVVRHRSSLEADLRAGYGEEFDTLSGHWRRIDLPPIEQEGDLVLHTDIDVIFVQPPLVGRMPRYLDAAPEFDKANLSSFRSGVMLMNLPPAFGRRSPGSGARSRRAFVAITAIRPTTKRVSTASSGRPTTR